MRCSIGVLLLAGCAYGATLDSLPNGADMVVYVYNRAGTPRAELAKAEQAATWLFARGGVLIDWLDCPTEANNVDCPIPSDPRMFVLSIESADPPATVRDTAFGYARPFSGGGNQAFALYPKIVELSAHCPGIVLGSVIAHELAHLLLRTNAHGAGVLNAGWTSSDLHFMCHGGIRFTLDQANKLRVGLQSRVSSMTTRK
jgi:hypothetical protein